MKSDKKWLRVRGYLHLTNQINPRDFDKVLKLTENPEKVATHGFFPLLHKEIPQRRFKTVGYDDNNVPVRKHKKFNKKTGTTESTKKLRPIHYATHLDAMIYAYYSNEILQVKYEELLSKTPDFADCISAYRRIPADDGLRNKNNIDFAKDVFDHIKERGECCALAFDIESFFTNLDHKILKKAWCKLLGTVSLPKDHYNIFKSITNYSYVLLDDFKKGKRGFDEAQLAEIRAKGVKAFFASPAAFKQAVKNGELRVFKNQYHDNSKRGNRKIRGIPQGLPISSMLANLYLLEFDKALYKKIAVQSGGFYRRYSDDIVVICDAKDRRGVQDFVVQEIEKYKLKISAAKTEVCVFEYHNKTLKSTGILNIKGNEVKRKGLPFRYLGFEFYGNKTLIKSANLSKFYRRMIYAVKTKAKRIESVKGKQLLKNVSLHKRKLYRIYSYHGKNSRKIDAYRSQLKINHEKSSFEFERKSVLKKYRGNYLSYAERASRIMEEPAIKRQLRKHWKILQRAIKRRIYDD